MGIGIEMTELSDESYSAIKRFVELKYPNLTIMPNGDGCVLYVPDAPAKSVDEDLYQLCREHDTDPNTVLRRMMQERGQ